MKKLMITKKLRYVLAVMAVIGCTSAFAAESQPSVQSQTAPNGYSYCHDGYGHGHHHGCGW